MRRGRWWAAGERGQSLVRRRWWWRWGWRGRRRRWPEVHLFRIKTKNAEDMIGVGSHPILEEIVDGPARLSGCVQLHRVQGVPANGTRRMWRAPHEDCTASHTHQRGHEVWAALRQTRDVLQRLQCALHLYNIDAFEFTVDIRYRCVCVCTQYYTIKFRER